MKYHSELEINILCRNQYILSGSSFALTALSEDLGFQMKK